jgi:hypothetical protein
MEGDIGFNFSLKKCCTNSDDGILDDVVAVGQSWVNLYDAALSSMRERVPQPPCARWGEKRAVLLKNVIG